MNILVCVKQVPNTRHMTIDPATNRLVRHGVSAMLNPADRYTLEKALRLRDRYGGTVTVFSMGAPQAEDVLVSAHLVGADRCVLLTDAAFAGSDTFATASVLAAAVHHEQQRAGQAFDIILCGRDTIDGETGQVGPELAELLGIPGFSNITRMILSGTSCEIEYQLDDMTMNVRAALPVLITYPLMEDAFLRPSLPDRLEKVNELKIPRLGMEELSPWLSPAEVGLKGSATRVVRSFVPSAQRKCLRITRGTPKEKAERLMDALVKDGILKRQSGSAADCQKAEAPLEKGSDRICVFVEQTREGVCKNVSLELLSPAIEMGREANLKVSAVLIGPDNARALAQLRQYPIDEIIACESPVLADMQPHDYTEALSGAIRQYHPEGLLIGGTEMGKALAARTAARFHTGLTAECSGVRYDAETGCIIWSRPAYGGKLMADIICKDRRPQMGTVRESVFVKPEKCPGNPEIIRLPFEKATLSGKVTLLGRSVSPGFVSKTGSDVSIIVGMGRGARDLDGFDLCCDFADAIGADIGASRGAVEMRLVSQQYMIGSNGKTVRPSVYFACGISGSLQHMTGVLDAGCIIAINSDPNAEIGQYANYFVVGDMFDVLPELIHQWNR